MSRASLVPETRVVIDENAGLVGQGVTRQSGQQGLGRRSWRHVHDAAREFRLRPLGGRVRPRRAPARELRAPPAGRSPDLDGRSRGAAHSRCLARRRHLRGAGRIQAPSHVARRGPHSCSRGGGAAGDGRGGQGARAHGQRPAAHRDRAGRGARRALHDRGRRAHPAGGGASSGAEALVGSLPRRHRAAAIEAGRDPCGAGPSRTDAGPRSLHASVEGPRCRPRSAGAPRPQGT